jgi:hypothetical protein
MYCLFRSSWLLVALLVATPWRSAQAEEPPANPEQPVPSWAPGPLIGLKAPDIPGRVIFEKLGLSMVLPEAWRGGDVAVRELSAEEAAQHFAGAEAAVLVEYTGGRHPVPLLSLYRAPREQYRALQKDGKAGPGRVILTTNEVVHVAVRPGNARVDDRFAELRRDVEEALSSLGLYDPRREGLGGPQIPVEWAGTLPDGQPIELSLERGGRLSVRWAGGREAQGQWLLRGSQIMAYVVGIEPPPAKPIVLHYDGQALTAASWDEAVFGPPGVRLERR